MFTDFEINFIVLLEETFKLNTNKRLKHVVRSSNKMAQIRILVSKLLMSTFSVAQIVSPILI